MHMADALISPAVGGVMWAAAAGVTAYSVKKVQNELDEKKIPLMGVMGAFVFAAQMINFTIPGTGSSGHLGGGMLLAILLGPYAGFLTMASILIIQALFFADGGLLAMGCNIFNLGFYTCFIAYPFIYKKIMQKGYTKGRLFAGAMLSSIVGLQLGAFSVVLETLFSGKTELPFGTFLMIMQPIHLAIGVVEGLITVAVMGFIWRACPEIVEKSISGEALGKVSIKKVLTRLIVVAVITGGILSWFASMYPDGLEWSILKTSGREEFEADSGIHNKLASIQEKIAFLPDYGFKPAESEKGKEAGIEASEASTQLEFSEPDEIWPVVDAGTSISGLVGSAMTLLLVGITGFVISFVKKKKSATAKEPV